MEFVQCLAGTDQKALRLTTGEAPFSAELSFTLHRKHWPVVRLSLFDPPDSIRLLGTGKFASATWSSDRMWPSSCARVSSLATSAPIRIDRWSEHANPGSA